MKLFSVLQQQIASLPTPPEGFLIALSGGVDSVVLLHLFAHHFPRHCPQIPVRAVHVHHGLSPNANAWADFCQGLCEQYGIPLQIKRVKVSGENGIEASARAVRYQAIREVLGNQRKNEVVVTAHHLDDQVETFFLALKRGAGVKGLAAMQAVSFSQKFPLFRPLLHTPKSEILRYAEQYQLNWVEDESNQSVQFERNFLRHQVLPKLNQQWQHFNQMVGRATQHLATQQQLLDELLETVISPYINIRDKTLAIQDFRLFSTAKQQALLRLWLQKCDVLMPSQTQLQQIIDNLIRAEKDKNPHIQLGETVIRRYQHQLFITPIFANLAAFCAELHPKIPIVLPDQLGTITRVDHEIIYQQGEKNARLILPHTAENCSLSVKLGQTGKVNLYGKTQREELKKIWQQHQIPIWQRSRTPLIFLGKDLLGLLKI